MKTHIEFHHIQTNAYHSSTFGNIFACLTLLSKVSVTSSLQSVTNILFLCLSQMHSEELAGLRKLHSTREIKHHLFSPAEFWAQDGLFPSIVFFQILLMPWWTQKDYTICLTYWWLSPVVPRYLQESVLQYRQITHFGQQFTLAFTRMINCKNKSKKKNILDSW